MVWRKRCIGPLDKRRMVRRCEQCRVRRTKCEGGWPCKACIGRLTICQDQTPKEGTQLQIILTKIPIALESPAESQLRSTTACLHNVYKFVGTCPSPITDLFSTSMLLRYFQEDESIRAALVHIGNAFITNSQQPVRSREARVSMEMEQRDLYATIQTRLQKYNSYLDPSILLLAVLFCLLQLMTTGSCNICLQILDYVTFYIVHGRGPHGFSTKFDKSTLLLFRILQGLGSLLRDQRTTFEDAKWCKTIKDMQSGGFPITREQETLFFECICTFVALLADINVQSQAWVVQERKFSRMRESCYMTMNCTCSICVDGSTYAKHIATGQNIIRQASQLLESIQRFEDVVKDSKSTHNPSYDMFFAHSLCLRIGTLRLFANCLWQNSHFVGEALDDSQVQSYAHSALNHVESRLQNSGLEAVIYIQHLTVIGIEVRDLASRHRVISLLQEIRSRGFVIAEVYIADMQLAWTSVPAV